MNVKMKNITVIIALIILMLFSVFGPGIISKSIESSVLNKIESVEDTYYLQRFQYNLPEGERLNLLIASLLGNGFSGSEHYGKMRHLFSSSNQSSYALTPFTMELLNDELTEQMAIDACLETLAYYSKKGLIPDFEFQYDSSIYEAKLYLALDTRDIERNLPVWQIKYGSNQPLLHRKNVLMEAYVDAQSGVVYLFSLRSKNPMENFDADALAKEWSALLGLGEYFREEETISNDVNLTYTKYRFSDLNTGDCDVYIGFYSGINEYFITHYLD